MSRYTRLIAFFFVWTPALAEDAKVPWPEHPRPDFQRAAWVNLNGSWAFAFDPNDVGEKEGWHRGGHDLDREIIVPFPWESKLSGIADTEYKGVAWYQREVRIPAGEGWEGKDPWLIIGACDFEAKVFVNGKEAASNVGGYLPFEINLAPFAKPGDRANIVIRAVDLSDPHQPTGKQVNWYTRNSGIWQTVYLEARHKSHIASFRCTPDIKAGEASFEIALSPHSGERYLRIRSANGKFSDTAIRCTESEKSVKVKVKVPDPQLWSPDSPTLYPVTLNVTDGEGVLDRVESYFGLRAISVGKAPGGDYKYIYLNGKPIYLLGALHQSFHPDGIYQYPDDAVMRSDYELCKKIGLNMLRIHIKIPVPRELYWADKLGVLIMQDMPCFWKYSQQARDWYEQMLRGAIERDFNHPSIFARVDFNETWGIEDGGYTAEKHKWVGEMYRLTKELDPTRLVEDNSPCKYDHVVTDINSWHFYINDYEEAKKHIAEVVEKTYPGCTFNYAQGFQQADAPLINSEYGGISAGLGDQDISWSFKFLTNELRKHDKICGYVYTELSDIEWEHNGFVNYDRSPKEFGYDYWHPGMTLKDLNSLDFIVIDAPPMIELSAGESRQVPIRISHWSDHKAKDLRLRWRTRWPLSEHAESIQAGETPSEWNSRSAAWKPFEVVDQPAIALSCDQCRGPVGALLLELVDGETVLARNYVNISAARKDGPAPVYAKGRDRLVMSFSPNEYAESTFAAVVPQFTAQNHDWVAASGGGHFQYELRVPEDIPLERLKDLHVMAELASHAGEAKLDWSARKTPHDRPQTNGKRWPSDLVISVNGVHLAKLKLVDDPADARGALSHHGGLRGAWGYLVADHIADADKLQQIVKEAGSERLLQVLFEVPRDAEHKGGLTIYGRGVGMNGMPPTVVLAFGQEGHGLAVDFKQHESPAVNRAAENILTPVATAEAGGQEWRFTTEEPPEVWTARDFDTSSWKTGKGAFGARGTPGAIIGTPWRKPEIWMRTTFTLEDAAAVESGRWRLFHDEDVQVYLNGKKVLERAGYLTNYIDEPLSEEALHSLKSGENVVAVHCRQTVGGQAVDVGLTLLKRPAEARAER